MSTLFDPLAPPILLDPTVRIRADRWRQAAASLRSAAGQIGTIVDDVAAFHRHDVWQGAVATRFGDDLGRWRSLLGTAHGPDGLERELLDVADRLDGKAAAIEGQAVGVIGAGAGPDDGLWWGRRG